MSSSASALAPLDEELGAWAAGGMKPRFWWRDDDLVGNSPNFARAVEWAVRLELHGLIAVIPGLADDTLADVTCRNDYIVVAQHGWKHQNGESPGRDKSEFGPDRALADGLLDLQLGHIRMSKVFGEFFFPVLVPPWNRMADTYLPLLRSLGYVGYSAYQHRPKAKANGVAWTNTHLDILDWSASPVAVRPLERIVSQLVDILKEKRVAEKSPEEPIGILTHHRSMPDDTGWRLLAELVALVRRHGGVWQNPREIFTAAGPRTSTARLQPVDEIDRSYSDADPWKYFESPEDANRRLQILANIPLRSYGRTLEIGCGNGFITLHLPGREVVGIDLSLPAVEHARSGARAREDRERFQFVHGSFADLDGVVSGPFDLIVLAGVLYPHYIGDAWVHVQRIIDRLLAPGGVVVSCHIDQWVQGALSLNVLRESRFSYRNYVQSIKVLTA